MMILYLAVLSIVLHHVYMHPVETIKRDRKRSVDVFLKPFDVEYKPLHVSSDIPVSFQETIQFWNSLAEGPPNQGILLVKSEGFEYEHPGTSVWNNHEDYADPYLLEGLAAKRAALILYSKELFFSDFPHERALLQNQDKRRLNGLPGNKLGSLRPNSIFERNKHHF